MKTIFIALSALVLSSCAGFPVFRCAFETRPDDLGMNECWDNQKREENRVCFDDWKKYGSYKQCIDAQKGSAIAEVESKPEIEFTDENGVKDCKFVGTFRGEGGGSSANKDAIGRAKGKAVENGASHFYLKETKQEKGQQFGAGEVTAAYVKAYDCAAKTAH